MKYLGYNDSGTLEYVDLEVEYPSGPTIINIAPLETGGMPRQVTADVGTVIVRLSSGGWPIIFTQEAFDASFKKVEE